MYEDHPDDEPIEYEEVPGERILEGQRSELDWDPWDDEAALKTLRKLERRWREEGDPFEGLVEGEDYPSTSLQSGYEEHFWRIEEEWARRRREGLQCTMEEVEADMEREAEEKRKRRTSRGD